MWLVEFTVQTITSLGDTPEYTVSSKELRLIVRFLTFKTGRSSRRLQKIAVTVMLPSVAVHVSNALHATVHRSWRNSFECRADSHHTEA
jgi:hypothetical protein